ncbi:MAG: hypothetical protein JWL83_70 [Actinomycetia bacterium]|nr:hypothetical protein [Actinomycetes bacterium]
MTVTHISPDCKSIPRSDNKRKNREHGVAEEGIEPSCLRCLSAKYPPAVHYHATSCAALLRGERAGDITTAVWLDVTCAWCLTVGRTSECQHPFSALGIWDFIGEDQEMCFLCGEKLTRQQIAAIERRHTQ